MNNAYIISGEGNITLIHEGKNYTIGVSHPNYKAIVECLKINTPHLLRPLLDVAKTIVENLPQMEVKEDNIFFSGQVVHNAVATRILDFMRAGLPFKPLARFLANLLENPSGRSLQELYGFLEHKGFPITEDGCFIAYKGVRNDYKDVHSGTFDNSVGQIIKIARNGVDDDCSRTCSYGFHAGTLEYASMHCGPDGHVMLVKINPRDCVSVPIDYNASKLRMCEYEVIGETTDRKLIETPTYGLRKADPYVEGRQAYLSGVPYQNPYKDQDARLWAIGWDEAYEIGYKAGQVVFTMGLSQDNNPYAEGSCSYDSWNEGWQDEADNYAQTGGQSTSPRDVEDATGRTRGDGGRFVSRG